MYMITTLVRRADPSGAFVGAHCHPPMHAPEALRVAMAGLDRGLGVEILDLKTGDVVSFADLRKVADSSGS